MSDERTPRIDFGWQTPRPAPEDALDAPDGETALREAYAMMRHCRGLLQQALGALSRLTALVHTQRTTIARLLDELERR
jgi:hypothetical protein